jgi:hypothetical protein
MGLESLTIATVRAFLAILGAATPRSAVQLDTEITLFWGLNYAISAVKIDVISKYSLEVSQL